jgi:feruloyl esterase
MRPIRRSIAIASLMTGSVIGAGAAMAADCQSLSGQSFGDARIIETDDVKGLIEIKGLDSGRTSVDKPFCRVRGVITPTSDSEIHFELWLPASETWNGKYEGVGGGGNAGNLYYPSMSLALNAGYAVSAQDTGHIGPGGESTYAVGHPEKVIDFGWRSLHETAVASKAAIEKYFGRAPSHSYYLGCSTGGRQGLALAQRFPNDYDGIVAGAPANYWPELNAYGAEFYRALLDDPDRWVSPAKLNMVNKAVVAACHGVNGVIDDPGNCRFDLSSLICKSGDSDGCLTQKEIDSLKLRYDDFRDSKGNSIYPAYTPGSEPGIGQGWMGPTKERRAVDSFSWPYISGFFHDYVHGGEPGWDVSKFKVEEDLEKARSGVIGKAVYAENPDLSPFQSRGGKLIQYHGWHDQGIPAGASVKYYESVAAKMGGIDKIQSFYRLFLGTGMGHCGGGNGPNAVGGVFGLPAPTQDAEHDLVAAVANWVENGVAPQKITATHFVDNDPAKGIDAQRPWCPYPAVARFDDKGDRSQASSYACGAPAK